MTQSDPSARTFRPNIRGSWFLLVGLLMGPAIIVFDRDPQGRKLLWVAMTVFFLGLILHRLGTSYRMDDRALTIRRWWGLLGETVIPYGEIAQVETRNSFASVLAGCGHVLVATGGGAWETVLSQKDPEALQQELETLRGEASFPEPDGEYGDADGGWGTAADDSAGTDAGEPSPASAGEPGNWGGETEADGGEPEADGEEPEADGGEPEADGGEPEADGRGTEANGGGSEAGGGEPEASGVGSEEGGEEPKKDDMPGGTSEKE